MKISSSFKKANLRSLILDMDGVLWRSSTLLGDLPDIFNTIQCLGLKVVMATNNSTRTPQQYSEKLAGYGVAIQPWQVINSSMATANYLKEIYPKGGNVFVVGEEGLVQTLEEHGFHNSPEKPLAVVSALDREVCYQKLTQATLLIRSGVPFIGTNPDRSIPLPEGQGPGAGSILAALEAATDVSPMIMGKPQTTMFNLALERLGTSPRETLVVGDRLETDIAGAQNAGCWSGLVLSGVTTLEMGLKWQPTPDIITDDLTTLLNTLRVEL